MLVMILMLRGLMMVMMFRLEMTIKQSRLLCIYRKVIVWLAIAPALGTVPVVYRGNGRWLLLLRRDGTPRKRY